MKKMKIQTALKRLYVEPVLRIRPLALENGLCVSGRLTPVDEEDAGISEWGV